MKSLRQELRCSLTTLHTLKRKCSTERSLRSITKVWINSSMSGKVAAELEELHGRTPLIPEKA